MTWEKLEKGDILFINGDGDVFIVVWFFEREMAQKKNCGSLDPFHFRKHPGIQMKKKKASPTRLGGNKNHQHSLNLLVKYIFVNMLFNI